MANGGMMRIGRIVSYVVATCSFQALLACDPIEYASVVEIVPKTCDFWRYAGEVRSASEAADPKVGASSGSCFALQLSFAGCVLMFSRATWQE
eukprot:3409156-Rhodomonas_salina.1